MFHDAHSFERTIADSSNLRISWDINDNLTLTSITTYQEYVSEARLDFDGTPANILTVDSSNGMDENAETFARNFASTDKPAM